MIPDYSKTLYDIKNLSGCDNHTTTFIQKLASLLLPDKHVLFEQNQDYKDFVDSKELQGIKNQNFESSFVAEIAEEAQKFDLATKV